MSCIVRLAMGSAALTTLPSRSTVTSSQTLMTSSRMWDT